MIDDQCSWCGFARSEHADHGRRGGLVHAFMPFKSARTLKVGDAVQTRDGRKARIVCDDLDGNHLGVLIASPKGEQFVVYKTHGRYWGGDTDSSENVNDLIPAPRKRTVWVMQWPESSHRTGRDVFTTSINPRHAETARADGAVACVRVEIEEGHCD